MGMMGSMDARRTASGMMGMHRGHGYARRNNQEGAGTDTHGEGPQKNMMGGMGGVAGGMMEGMGGGMGMMMSMAHPIHCMDNPFKLSVAVSPPRQRRITPRFGKDLSEAA
jgi:hypothetical protein